MGFDQIRPYSNTWKRDHKTTSRATRYIHCDRNRHFWSWKASFNEHCKHKTWCSAGCFQRTASRADLLTNMKSRFAGVRIKKYSLPPSRSLSSLAAARDLLEKLDIMYLWSSIYRWYSSEFLLLLLLIIARYIEFSNQKVPLILKYFEQCCKYFEQCW